MNEQLGTPEPPLAVVLATAAATAGYAPSVHNTQPWHWRVQPGRLELFADRTRQLTATDPDGRLLLVSCGTALHHALVALAAQGWTAAVDRTPDPDRPDLLATVVADGRTPVTADATRLAAAVRTRHTDRRPVADRPLPVATLAAVAMSVTGQARVRVLDPDQVLDLAAATSRAAAVEADEPAVRAELAYWTGRAAPDGTGLPAEVLLDQAARTTVPARDFGRPGTLPAGAGHDRDASYLLLYGDDDEPSSWLRAGEALSVLWLTAVGHGVSVLPLSTAVEVEGTRQVLRGVLAHLGHPYLVVRLGYADDGYTAPPAPRLPTATVVDA